MLKKKLFYKNTNLVSKIKFFLGHFYLDMHFSVLYDIENIAQRKSAYADDSIVAIEVEEFREDTIFRHWIYWICEANRVHKNLKIA